LTKQIEIVVMDMTANVFAQRSQAVLSAGLFLAMSSSAALSNEPGAPSNEKCQQLEELSRQYASVELTSVQKQLKRKLMTWYNANCGVRRAVARG
jgi:hypothetical protein